MQVVYLGRPNHRTNPPQHPQGDVMKLLSDNLDDHGFKTSFLFTCLLGG